MFLRLDLVLTYGIRPEFRGGVHLFIKNRHTPSGQSRVCRVMPLRTDGVHCRESAGTGPVNLKVVPNDECCLGRSPFFFLFSFFYLTYSRWTSSLPSCLWSQRIFPSLPGSRLTFFLSRCKFSTLTTRQPMVEFYLLTFPRFPLRKKEHKSYFGKNRTHDFRTSRCAAYLLDHTGDGTTNMRLSFPHPLLV